MSNKKNPTQQLFDDFSQLAASTFGSLIDARHELEDSVRKQFNNFAANAGFVSREEFEVVREMVVKARQENEMLKKQIAALQGKAHSHKEAATKPKAAAPVKKAVATKAPAKARAKAPAKKKTAKK